MAQLLVRRLDAETIDRLKARAKRHGRSLQGEVHVILVQATALSMKEAQAVSSRWYRRLVGKPFSDSARLIREDRAR